MKKIEKQTTVFKAKQRFERQAMALRRNLRRRKTQQLLPIQSTLTQTDPLLLTEDDNIRKENKCGF